MAKRGKRSIGIERQIEGYLGRPAYETAASEAARLSAATRGGRATAEDHLRAADANRAAARLAKSMRDEDSAASHERLAFAHEQSARRTPAVSRPAPIRHGITPRALDATGFAAAVHRASGRVGPEGRYGPHKVFVSAIWRELAGDPNFTGTSIADFKRRLLAAHRDDLLSLARADLVGAMNLDQVSQSEIRDRGASFHFVLDPRSMP